MIDTAVTIHLRAFHDTEGCEKLATQLHDQLNVPEYSREVSLQPLVPRALWQAGHKTARQRVRAAQHAGYLVKPIVRREHVDEIGRINMSLPIRQGRPMAASYLEPPVFGIDPPVECSQHGFHTYGCLDREGRLVAYSWVYRAGQLVMFSSILGHGAHLQKHVMYLLVADILDDQWVSGGNGWAFYNRHDSGEEGLRWFKERCGFQPMDVRWAL